MTRATTTAADSRGTVNLRPVRPADAALLDQWRREPSVRRFQPLSEASGAELVRHLDRNRPEDLYRGTGDRYQWILSTGDRPAGWITLAIVNWRHGLAEIGYAVSTPFQGRGLVALGLTQLLDDLFERTDLRRIEARCAIDNRASRAVLEKLGFAFEGELREYFVLRGQPVDNALYAILRRDWLARDSDGGQR